MTSALEPSYARTVADEVGVNETRHRRRVYAGVAVAVLALVLATLLVDPPAERAQRAEDERRLDAIRSGVVLRVDPSVYLPVPREVDPDRYPDAVLACPYERKAAAADGRVEPAEAQRIERACGAH